MIRRASDRYDAAKALRAWVEEMAPDLGASLWADLLGAALSEVDWDEIAGADWDELHPDDEDEEEDDEDEAHG